MIKYGMLDRSIVVERSSETLDESGTPSFVWSHLHDLRAAVLSESMQEASADWGESSVETITFRVSWASDLTLADRVVYQSKTYNIKEIKPIMRRRALELVCRATGG